MKTIYLVRHAQAAPSGMGQSDFDRPLVKAGIKKSISIGRLLSGRGVNPALILSSNAVRAKDTARILARGMGYPEKNILLKPEIYLGSADDLLDMVSLLPDELTSVMVVGHNPSMTGFAMLLRAGLQSDMPPSAVISISADTDSWQRLLTSKKHVNFIIGTNIGKKDNERGLIFFP